MSLQPSHYRPQALALLREEGAMPARELARRLGLHERAVQRWYHDDDFKAALEASHGLPCPRCHGTGRLTDVVYFVRRRADGLVKIGTSRGLKLRLNELRSTHGPVTLLASEPGDRWRERQLHERFKDMRAEGEWYTPGASLLAYIEALRFPHPGD